MKLTRLAAAITLATSISTTAFAATGADVESKGAKAVIAEALQQDGATIESVISSLASSLKDSPAALSQVINQAVASNPQAAAQIISIAVQAAPQQARSILANVLAQFEGDPQMQTLIEQAADDALESLQADSGSTITEETEAENQEVIAENTPATQPPATPPPIPAPPRVTPPTNNDPDPTSPTT